MLDIQVRPIDEQTAEWRRWAASPCDAALQQEALRRLAWARDPEGQKRAVAALASGNDDVRATAAQALFEYGPAVATGQAEALQAALRKTAGPTRLLLGWALVLIGKASGVKPVLDASGNHGFDRLRRLDGGQAFDPRALAAVMSSQEVNAFAEHASAGQRVLAARLLAARPSPRLVELARDPDAAVAGAAAPGLLALGSEGRRLLLEVLRGAHRTAVLAGLREVLGTPGLILGLESTGADPPTAWLQTEQAMSLIGGPADQSEPGLNDPRGADALLAFMESRPHIHWQTRATLALANLGDVRAVPTLALRLRLDPLKIYSGQLDLQRSDRERIASARLLAELAVLHPDQRPWMRKQAESAVVFWITRGIALPHADGMRALAAMEAQDQIRLLRQWADPQVPLPVARQQPPIPEEWLTARSALRYVGWMRGSQSWNLLQRSLRRRPKQVDASWDSLMSGGFAVLGMTLRGLGVGASQGFSEWGDPRAFQPLMHYIEDPRENELGRMEAGAALGWVATPADVSTVVEKLAQHSGHDPAQQTIRSCLLEALIARPRVSTSPALLSKLTAAEDPEVRHQLARALGRAGLTEEAETRLFDLLHDEALMSDAALALMLGGSAGAAGRAVAMCGAHRVKVLQELWHSALGYWSTEDLEQGRLFRLVDNAAAISRVQLDGVRQRWAEVLLARQFDNLVFDNGPHSLTRVVLRYRLWHLAEVGVADQRDRAIRTLELMRERGVLLALCDEPGDTGRLASLAYQRALNPSPEVQSVVTTDP